MDITLEQVERLREKADVSYAQPRRLWSTAEATCWTP